MAFAKIILNGDVLMDVTSDTVSAGKLLSDYTATKNDGTKITGTYVPPAVNISALTVTPTESQQTFNAAAVSGYKPVTVNGISSTYVGTGVSQRSAADITKSSNQITAPMGYYSQSATYTVSAYSHTSPSIEFTSSTGKIKALHSATDAMQNWGMLTGYTTTSSEYTLTTQAAQTIYPSTADQTISRYTWLTGFQTIKSATTTNLTAENIADGVVVKVGDSDNASRIAQITGTHKGGPTYTATIISSGSEYGTFVKYNNIKYYTENDTFEFTAGDTLTIYVNSAFGTKDIYINGTIVGSGEYIYTLPSHNINIELYAHTVDSYAKVEFPTISIVENGTYDVLDYVIADVSVAGGGSSDAEDGIIQRTISGAYENSRVSTIGNYAFAYCYNLTTASFPSVTTIGVNAFYNCIRLTTASFSSATSIGNYAFAGCSSLTTVSFPSVTWIGSSAFYNCFRLTTASFPSVTTISGGAFYSCSGLTTVSFPSATLISTYAFRYCYNLTTASFPSVTTIGSSAFQNCSNLTTVSFPNATSISANAFVNCSNLTAVNFPNVTTISGSAFYGCSNLTTASFSNVTTLGGYAFASCYNLMSVIFLASSVVYPGTNVFSSTPIGGYTTSTGGVYGSIYVPASLVDSYKTNAYWTVYSDRITSYVE